MKLVQIQATKRIAMLIGSVLLAATPELARSSSREKPSQSEAVATSGWTDGAQQEPADELTAEAALKAQIQAAHSARKSTAETVRSAQEQHVDSHSNRVRKVIGELPVSKIIAMRIELLKIVLRGSQIDLTPQALESFFQRHQLPSVAASIRFLTTQDNTVFSELVVAMKASGLHEIALFTHLAGEPAKTSVNANANTAAVWPNLDQFGPSHPRVQLRDFTEFVISQLNHPDLRGVDLTPMWSARLSVRVAQQVSEELESEVDMEALLRLRSRLLEINLASAQALTGDSLLFAELSRLGFKQSAWVLRAYIENRLEALPSSIAKLWDQVPEILLMKSRRALNTNQTVQMKAQFRIALHAIDEVNRSRMANIWDRLIGARVSSALATSPDNARSVRPGPTGTTTEQPYLLFGESDRRHEEAVQNGAAFDSLGRLVFSMPHTPKLFATNEQIFAHYEEKHARNQARASDLSLPDLAAARELNLRLSFIAQLIHQIESGSNGATVSLQSSVGSPRKGRASLLALKEAIRAQIGDPRSSANTCSAGAFQIRP